MFSSNSGRKSLLRNGSERSSMKNWPLFAFLFGLVFFFYIFYVYQVQNTEFALNREQLEIQLRQVKALKNELIDVKVELERIGVSEATAKRQYNECNTKLSDCSTSLRASKIKIENILLEKTKCEKYMGDNQSLILDLKNNVTELERNNTAQRMLISTQTVLLAQLNQTVQALKTEVSVLRSGHSSSPQQSSKEVIPQNKNSIGEVAPVARVDESLQQIEKQTKKVEIVADANLKITDGLKRGDVRAEAPDLPDTMDENYKKEEQQLHLPNSPEDRVKLEMERRLEDEKEDDRPIVKGGDYDNKQSEVEKDDADKQFVAV